MGPCIELKEVEPGTESAVWRERIVAWAESGLAQVEFCRLHGLSLDQFRRYRTRLTRRPRDSKSSKPIRRRRLPEFVELTVLNTAPALESRPALEVRLGDGRCVGVHPGFDPRTLRTLLACLEGEQ